jgi:hypothetical protein
MTRRTITLTIADKDFDFTLGAPEVTKYFNAMTQTNKIAPAHNLLSTSVKADQRDDLKLYLVNPVTVIQIAGALLEEFSPDVEITVKKPSDTLSA